MSRSRARAPSRNSDAPSSPTERRYRQNPAKYPKGLQWMLEVDYIKKLSPAERAYLYAFHEAEYGGNGEILHDDIEEIRRLWRENKKQQADAMNGAVHDMPLENRTGQQNPEDVLIEAIDGKARAELKERAKARADKREKERLAIKRRKQRMRKRLMSNA